MRVIVRALPGQRGALGSHLRRQGNHEIQWEHELIDAFTVMMPLAALPALESRPFVASVSLDVAVTTNQSGGGSTGLPYLLRPTLGLDSQSPQGSGVTVAVLDSGIYPSADFGNRITAFYDFTQGGIATAPYDDYGHGTHIAGLIGGSGNNSMGAYAGVAPQVSLVGIKALDATGAGVTSNVIAALEFAIQNKSTLHLDVINLSLGHPIYESAATDPLVQAVQSAVAAGIVVVVAAGNYGVNPSTGLPGYGGISSPGNAPAAITVGSVNLKGTSTRSDDVINNYSSRGPTWYDGLAKPDLVAAGYQVIAPAAPGSTLAERYPSFLVNGTYMPASYMKLSGTSMAAAVASGVAALAIQANRPALFTWRPPITPNAVKGILEFSALNLNDPATLGPYDVLTQGAGGLNAQGVVALAQSIDTSVPLGQTWLAMAVYPWSTISNELAVWHQSILWGNGILWGDTIYVNRSAWSTGVLWGDNVLWGDSILWGDCVEPLNDDRSGR